MAIFLDFVGLNTLIYEPISSSVNTIGYRGEDIVSTPVTASVLRQSKCLHSPDIITASASLSANNITSYPTTGGFSNSFWIKLDDVDTGTRRIWLDSSGSSTNTALWFTGGGISFLSTDDEGDNKRWDWDVEMSDFLEWQHIVLTWEGDFSTAPRLHANNEEVVLSNTVSAGASGSERLPITSIHLFANPNSEVLAYNLSGKLQEFAFYGKELSSQEITEIYNNGEYYDLQQSTISENISSYWYLGEELSDNSYGDLIPSGTVINAAIGSVDLTVQDNMFIAEGFYIKNASEAKDLFSYENNSLGVIPQGASLAALNIHRNGPYGFPTFKQIRASENPLTRYHNKNSIFSYVKDGTETVTNGRQVFVPKYSNLTQIQESPIVSNNKPLTMVGGVSEYNRRTGKTSLERVEVQASPTNEIQFFGDEQANRDFGLDMDTHESYEDLTELYLDGGIESEDSPIDQFEILRYQHQIYPREQNSYLEHVRGRSIYWEPGYWKDLRSERTETGLIDNGFGFTIPSQSIWPLDVEEDWSIRPLLSTVGYFTMSSPSNFRFSLTSRLPNGDPIPDGIYMENYYDGAILWTHTPTASSYRNEYDTVTGEGKIFGKLYGMNSREGTQEFYANWVSLIEKTDLEVVSTGSSINVRYNIDTSDIPYEDGDSFYMEISSAAHSYIETELSHSLVHFWSREEDGILGHIYREVDGSHKHKRSVSSRTSSYHVDQATKFSIISEDGTISHHTGSTISFGGLGYVFRKSEIDNFRANEWNNNIVTFGDPSQDGNESIKLYANGNSVPAQEITDVLDFFDSNGDMRTSPIAYQPLAYVSTPAATESWNKIHSLLWGDGHLNWSPSDPSEIATTEDISVGFYYKNTLGNQIIPTNDHQLLLVENAGTVSERFSIHVYKEASLNYPEGRFRFRVRFEPTATEYKEYYFDIHELSDTLTKYLFLLRGNTDKMAGYYYDTSDDTVKTLTAAALPTRSSGIGSYDLETVDGIEIFDDTENTLVDSTCSFSSVLEAQNQDGVGTFNQYSDGDNLSEIVILNKSGSSGFDGNIPEHREKYFNGNATIDFSSSYWPYTQPVAWYRFGNGSQQVTTTGTNFVLNDLIYDDSGNNRHLQSKPNQSSACVETPVGSYEHLTFRRVDGPIRETQQPLGYHTSSVGGAYLLCATSSVKNDADDFLQNAKIAEFALIQSSSATNISSFIPIETTLDDFKKYTYKDLTSTSTTASIWYAFDDSDSITSTSSLVQNQNTSYPTYGVSTTYSSTTKIPTIENEGLETGSTFQVSFKAKYVDHDPQETFNDPSTAIPSTTFVSSSIIGESLIGFYIGGYSGYNAEGGPGILMNSYNSFNVQPVTGTDDIDTYLSAACHYTRRHTLKHSSSFQHPFVSGGTGFFKGIKDFEDYEIYQGMAEWDAARQSGKKPFYDDYGKYAAEMRLTNKDYTVVPEFKISQHIDKYLLKGDTQFDNTDNPLLEVTGADGVKWNSNVDSFYETYSTTDFLKMFDIIQEEHDDFVNPISLKLKCKGVKKFLPYKGFYPADRTVDISEQFYNSYGDYLSITSSYSGDAKYAAQNLLTPLFSPGILFNTIKSGVACDYPIMTGSFATSSYVLPSDTTPTGSYHINEQFHKRIPFEALIEPEKYLANQQLHPQEPDPLGNLNLIVTWNGGGDEKYRLMVSNFLAETGEFFLKNKDFASISSLPEGDPNFGNAEAGKTYMMRIKMYRTISGDKDLWEIDPGETYTDAMVPPVGTFSVPQDTGSMEQAFMMYSRPSAFGPPQRITLDDSETEYEVKFTNWASYKRTESLDFFYNVTESVLIEPDNNPVNTHPPTTPFTDLRVDTDGHFLIGNDPDVGYNYPFTPPYYHGEGWADIVFRASSTEKLTLSQIINSSSVEFLRYYEPIPDASNATHGDPEHYHTNWRLVNEDAMQLASSVNIFSKGVLKQDITQTKRQGIRNDVQVQVDTNIGNQYRWIIQSKFETPILNFNHLNHNSEGVSIPNVSRHTTPIGMWHQYGLLPQSPNEGVFLQVSDVPSQWIDNAMNAKSYQTGSLVELCGFSTDPVRLGDVAPTKTIKEAVVAIPFVERNGQREFFTIDREDINNAIEPSTKNLVGKTIQDMVKRMKDYVFPPSMDFINNDDIDPFAMYIFEFKHTLDKQDLADIWQNLPPDIGEYHEEAEAVISHELLAHELLGGKADLKPGRNTEFELNRQVRKDKIDSKIRWMIFKVKQRAKTNYFEKIFARNESQEAGTKLNKTTLSSIGASNNASYNWPYDYFSLVELIKMDAEIDFARPDDENQEEKLVIKPFTKVISNSANQTILNNALFGAELPEPEQPEGLIQERIPKGKKRK